MPDDLRWSWYNKNRNKVHNKCNALKSSPNHTQTPLPLNPPRSMEKLSSMKLVPDTKMVGDHWDKTIIKNIQTIPKTQHGKTKNSIKKQAKDMNRHLNREDIQEENTHYEKMLNIMTWGNCKLKWGIIIHLLGWQKIQNTDNTQCCLRNSHSSLQGMPNDTAMWRQLVCFLQS